MHNVVTVTAVQGIATTWASLVLDMGEYKATYKLRSTEEVFAALEDNTVTLSTMKASRFFAVFEKDITLWEKTLSLVSETIELVLTVGHNLLYLDAIISSYCNFASNILIWEEACSFCHLSCPLLQHVHSASGHCNEATAYTCCLGKRLENVKSMPDCCLLSAGAT